MDVLPKTGQSHQFLKTIDKSLTIQFGGLPPVLSTPHLIWNLELAAMELLEHFLDEAEITLGVHVDIEHVGTALVGDSVQFVAMVVQSSSKEILFRVTASNSGVEIARGLHKRKLVSIAKLRERLKR